MSKLYRARPLLYRRQILQQNIRWKALDEIYKIYMFLHRSDLNISEKNRQIILHFVANVARFCFLKMLVIDVCSDLMKFCRNFADIESDILENVEIFRNFRIF